MTKTPKTETAARNCECAKYRAVTGEQLNEHGEFVDTIEIGTGCTRTTKNDFAQGHDAKLKSALIAWGVAGYEVAWVEGGMRIGSDAMGVAGRYGFAHMVADGIAKGVAKRQAAQDRADRKHEAQAARQAKKAGKAPKVDLNKAIVSRETAPEAVVESPVAEVEEIPAGPIKAKVGRWVYTGVIVDDRFHYTSKLGQTKSTSQFQVV